MEPPETNRPKGAGFFNGLLRFVAYTATKDPLDIGSIVTLRDNEISFVCDNPVFSHAEIIRELTPRIRNGFDSGDHFVKVKLPWWEHYHMHLAKEERLHLEEIANLSHFPVTDIERVVDEESTTTVTPQEAWPGHFARMAAQLAENIATHGDCRKLDHRPAAFDLMAEAYEDILSLPQNGGRLLEELMKRDGVRRERLPARFTIRDYAYESMFVNVVGIHSRRCLRPRQDIVDRVRKEQVPSWVIWQEIDRRLKTLPKAEVGNLNDKYIACFAPYVDVLNSDKRISEIIRQAARTCPLLSSVLQKVPKSSGLGGLISKLKE